MIATGLVAFLVLVAVGAFALMRAHGRKSAAAYDRRTGRRMIEQVVHHLIDEHDEDAPMTGKVLDEAWAAGNDAPAVFGLATEEVREGAEMALAVYERIVSQADSAAQHDEDIPTLGDLLDAVRATSLDLHQTTGATR